MAIISSSDQNLSLSAHIARHALGAAVAKNVASRRINTYSLDGKASRVLSLSRYADIGLPDSVSFATEYTGEAAFTTTAVTMTPTRKAKGATIDRETYTSRVDGFTLDEVLRFINNMADLDLNDEDAVREGVAMAMKAFGPEISMLVGSLREGWEYDTTSLYASVTASAGTSGAAFTVATIEEAIADICGAQTLPHERLYADLDPEQLKDLRADLRTTTNAGVLEAGLASVIAHDSGRNVDGARGAILGVPVFEHGPEVRQTANAGEDVLGVVAVEGSGDPEDSGAGYPGAFAMCVAHRPVLSAQYHGNAFGVRLVADCPSAHAIRVNGWACKLVTDAP